MSGAHETWSAQDHADVFEVVRRVVDVCDPESDDDELAEFLGTTH